MHKKINSNTDKELRQKVQKLRSGVDKQKQARKRDQNCLRSNRDLGYFIVYEKKIPAYIVSFKRRR